MDAVLFRFKKYISDHALGEEGGCQCCGMFYHHWRPASNKLRFSTTMQAICFLGNVLFFSDQFHMAVSIENIIYLVFISCLLTLGLFQTTSWSILLKKSDLLLAGNSGSSKSSPFFRQALLIEEYFCCL